MKRSRADVGYAIDLLWGHQIRRENAILHKQLQQLQTRFDQPRHIPQTHVEAIECAQTTANQARSAGEILSDKVSKIEDDASRIHESLQTVSGRVDALANEVRIAVSDYQATSEKIVRRLEAVEASIDQEKEEVTAQTAKTAADLHKISELVDNKANRGFLDALLARIDDLEERLAKQEESQNSQSRVVESVVEVTGQPQLAIVNDVPDDKNVAADKATAEEEEYMLTMRDIEPDYRSTSLDESIDLDQNATMLSYARNAAKLSRVTDSLQPIEPNAQASLADLSALDGLRQGRYDSWGRYLAEYRVLVEHLPKDRESWLVHKIVDGLYATNERNHCARWLDHKGWRMESILAYRPVSIPPEPIQPVVAVKHQQPVDPMKKGAPIPKLPNQPRELRKTHQASSNDEAVGVLPLAQNGIQTTYEPVRAVQKVQSATAAGSHELRPLTDSTRATAAGKYDLRPRKEQPSAFSVGKSHTMQPPRQREELMTDKQPSSRPSKPTSKLPAAVLASTKRKRSEMTLPQQEKSPRRSQRLAALRNESMELGNALMSGGRNPPANSKAPGQSAAAGLQSMKDKDNLQLKAQNSAHRPPAPSPKKDRSFLDSVGLPPSFQRKLQASQLSEARSLSQSPELSNLQRGHRLTRDETLPSSPEPVARVLIGKHTVESARRSVPRTVQETSSMPTTPTPEFIPPRQAHQNRKPQSVTPICTRKRHRESVSSIASFLRGTSAVDADIDQMSDGMELPPVPVPAPDAELARRKGGLKAIWKTARSAAPITGKITSNDDTAVTGVARAGAEETRTEDQHQAKRCRVGDKRSSGRGKRTSVADQPVQRTRRWPPPPEIPILPTSDVEE